MIVKEINIEGVEQNRFEVKKLLEDKSLRGDLFSVDEEGNEVGERLHNAVILEPWPFELTEEETNQLKPKDNELANC